MTKPIDLELTVRSVFNTIPVNWKDYFIIGDSGVSVDLNYTYYTGWEPNIDISYSSVPSLLVLVCHVYNAHT